MCLALDSVPLKTTNSLCFSIVCLYYCLNGWSRKLLPLHQWKHRWFVVVAPGPVQCKGLAHTLHYQCNTHHGHFLNVVASFWPEDSTFCRCWPCCCPVLIATAPTHWRCRRQGLCRVCFEPVGCCEDGMCRSLCMHECWNVWWVVVHHRHFPPLQASAKIVKTLTFLCVTSLHTRWLWLVFKHEFFREVICCAGVAPHLKQVSFLFLTNT